MISTRIAAILTFFMAAESPPNETSMFDYMDYLAASEEGYVEGGLVTKAGRAALQEFLASVQAKTDEPGDPTA